MAASRRFSNTTRSNCAYANGGGVGGGSDFIEPKDDKSTTAGSGSTGTTTTTITTTTRAVVDPNHALGSGPDGLGRRDDEEEDTAPESSIGEFDPVDILDLDSDSQCWQTVRSSVYRHFWERGRRYHRYRYGRYPIPNDDEEQHRDELKHCMHMEITDGVLFFSPVGDNPQKIADLGTGTGSWAIEVADRFPSAVVIGTDLSPIQPHWIPPNLRFVVDDLEDEWTLGSDFDLVHLRHVTPMIRDAARLLRQAICHLKPGGWIELQEFTGYIQSDHESSEVSDLAHFWDKTAESLVPLGFNYRVADSDLGTMLEKAGYVDIVPKTFKVPIGTWPKNKILRLCGLYMKENVLRFIEALASKPLLGLGLEPDEAEELTSRAIRCTTAPGAYPYLEYRFWMGRKPLPGERRPNGSSK